MMCRVQVVGRMAGARQFIWQLLAGWVLAGYCLSANVFADARHYEIDPHNSYIHIYTDKAGLLSAFAHRHLIAIRDMAGSFDWRGEGSKFRLVFRPENFLVDDEQESKRAVDKKYARKVSRRVQSGTRNNMLGEKLLDAKNHPVVTAELSLHSLNRDQALFDVTLTVKDKTFQISIPAAMTVDANTIHVVSDFELNHSELGLKPFSVPVAGIKVAKPLRFYLDILAVASP